MRETAQIIQVYPSGQENCEINYIWIKLNSKSIPAISSKLLWIALELL